MTYLEHTIAGGHAKITGEGKHERIHYVVADHSGQWADPEEKVRAEFRAGLICKYEYQSGRIGLDVKVERRTPQDLVICADDDCKDRWFIFECKRADVSTHIP